MDSTASKQATTNGGKFRVVWFCPVTGRLNRCDFRTAAAAKRNAENLSNRGAMWGAL